MDLHKALQVIWRRRLAVLAVLVLGALSTAFLLYRIRPLYVAQASVLMVAQGPQRTSTLDQPSGVSTTPVLSSDLPALVSGPAVVEGVARKLGMPKTQTAYTNLQAKIGSKIQTDSNILRIQFRDASPRMAVLGANATADELTSFYRSLATARIDSLTKDLSAQLAAKRSELRRLDGLMMQASAADPFVDAKDGSQSINARLIQLLQDQGQAAASVRADEAQNNVIDRRTAEVTPWARRDISTSNPTYYDLQAQYAKDRALLVHAQSQYQGSFPGMAELQETVNRERYELIGLEKQLASVTPVASAPYAAALADRNKAHATAAADQARLSELNRQISDIQGKLDSSASNGGSIAAIRRDRQATEAAFTVLAGRLQSAAADRAQAASVASSVIVLNHAGGAEKATLFTASIIIGAMSIISLWIAISIAYLLDAADTRLVDPRTMEKTYGAPVLARVGRDA